MTGDPASSTPTIDAAKPDRFDEWAIVELMGHQRMAGRVIEATIAGAAMLRIDVPAIEIDDTPFGEPQRMRTVPAYTRFVSPAAVYAINPTTEDVARRAARYCAAEPLKAYAPEPTAPQLPGRGAYTADPDAEPDGEPDDDQPW